jgi:putative Mn2+ efflux pump MntP
VEPSGSKNSSIFKVENVIIDISLDELAIGFQGFLMMLIGIRLGSTLRTRLRAVKEWTERLSVFLLIGLGLWLLLT